MPAQSLKRVARRLLMIVKPETAHYDGMLIPAKHLRFGGKHFQSDADFSESARREANRLVERCGLTKDSTVLEIGCGPGRLPIGIIDRVGDIRKYIGIDVSATPIEWCQRHITRNHPNFQFIHSNVQNPRYNKTGKMSQSDFGLPSPDNSIDIVYHYSVFSHLVEADIRAYLAEFRRVMRMGGKMFFTAFVEKDVPRETENPAGYGEEEWKGPLHCVRFESEFFRDMLREYGFSIDAVEQGAETDGQSGFYVTSILKA